MSKDNILDWLGEIYHYKCSICPRANMSRDEVHHLKSGEFMCLKCWYATKSKVVDKLKGE